MQVLQPDAQHIFCVLTKHQIVHIFCLKYEKTNRILCRHKAIKTTEKASPLLFHHKKSPSIKIVKRAYSTTKMLQLLALGFQSKENKTTNLSVHMCSLLLNKLRKNTFFALLASRTLAVN